VATASRTGFGDPVLRHGYVMGRIDRPWGLHPYHTGLGGLVVPFIARALLKSYGRKTTCLAFVSHHRDDVVRYLMPKQAIAYTLLLSCAVPFIKPRLPLPRKQASGGSFPMRLLKGSPSNSDRTRRIPTERETGKWRCLRSSAFWLLFTGVLLQGLGGFVPGTYLPCRF
jgi:hypothetical protein